MRIFIALPVPVDVQDELSGLNDGLPVFRAVPAEQMHVTLAFCAAADPGALHDLNAALEDIRAYPFDVAFSGLDIFGGGKPRLLAAMIRLSPELVTLHRSVLAAARRAGLEIRRQKFRPHVTLVRFGARPPAHLPAVVQRFLSDRATAPIPGFVADRIVLTQSTLGGPGPVYEDLAEYPFRPLPDFD